ncbi:hypothetical protein [Myxosarcina sp. GI1]|uniref:Npun_F0296 family exosortase-dependent surface protein n=1 Tax=Myxosarcina sp. GI1 TaxID=1541065 RepID=UPI00055A3FBF|nr:hypothetical protein [Myxosarcina sp. GI1]
MVDFNDLTIDSTDSFSKQDSENSSIYSYDGDLIIKNTTIFGGADNSYFIEPKIYDSSSFNISADRKQKYFGLWWSAGDSSNVITFYNDEEIVAVFNTQNVINTLAELSNKEDYYCNPTSLFNGEVCHEPYAFINFFFENGEVYNKITIETNVSNGNFESDNHTFSIKEQDITGVTVVSMPLIYVD